MEMCLKLPLEEKQLDDIVRQAKDYLLSHGIVLRSAEMPDNGDLATIAPVTLLPSPVPRVHYEEALRIQNAINLLMHKIALNRDFLWTCLERVIKVDQFTRNLWEIYDTVTKEGLSQPYSLGLNRSDYMLDCGVPTAELIESRALISPQSIKLQMIEVNVMASSFGGLSQRLKHFHKFILDRLGLHEQTAQIPAKPSVSEACDVLAKGLLTAWQCYRVKSSVVLFLVLDKERNIYDQRHLEYSLYDLNPKVKVIYRTLKDITERGHLTDEAKLIIDDCEVAVVYQRSLYIPAHYQSEQDWKTRLLIERSKAIKCPSAGYHLAGTKKVQQVLARRGIIEQFITDQEMINAIRNTFAGQYSLELDEEGNNNFAMALANPHLYVLKPQREGGGNNTYGENIQKILSELGSSMERTAYILMDYIHPYPVLNYLLRPGKPLELHNCVTELGIYGAFVGTEDKVITNLAGGSLLRTKAVGTDEGGVATGYSCLDSPFLV